MHRVFPVATNGPGLYEITATVQHWLRAGPMAEGVLTLFIRHSSASLLIQENADPSVQRDLVSFFNRLAPPADDPAMGWITHRAEGNDDMPAHLKAAVLPTSLQIPVVNWNMVLGKWQGIFIFEHRTQPKRREIVAILR